MNLNSFAFSVTVIAPSTAVLDLEQLSCWTEGGRNTVEMVKSGGILSLGLGHFIRAFG